MGAVSNQVTAVGRGGGHTRLRVRGSPNSADWRKKHSVYSVIFAIIWNKWIVQVFFISFAISWLTSKEIHVYTPEWNIEKRRWLFERYDEIVFKILLIVETVLKKRVEKDLRKYDRKMFVWKFFCRKRLLLKRRNVHANFARTIILKIQGSNVNFCEMKRWCLQCSQVSSQ